MCRSSYSPSELLSPYSYYIDPDCKIRKELNLKITKNYR